MKKKDPEGFHVSSQVQPMALLLPDALTFNPPPFRQSGEGEKTASEEEVEEE